MIQFVKNMQNFMLNQKKCDIMQKIMEEIKFEAIEKRKKFQKIAR